MNEILEKAIHAGARFDTKLIPVSEVCFVVRATLMDSNCMPIYSVHSEPHHSVIEAEESAFDRLAEHTENIIQIMQEHAKKIVLDKQKRNQRSMK